MKSLLFIFSLISISYCLKLNLVDDYFVKVYVGDSKQELKLLVDPTYSFTYIFKQYESKTKKMEEEKPHIYSTIYGNFSGSWANDTFYFKEDNTTINMKFLDIHYTKDIFVNADGVLGLGLYDYLKFDRSIFKHLDNCQNNLTIYDKTNKQILLCESDESNKDSMEISLKYKDLVFNDQGLISISKLKLKQPDKDLKIDNYENLAFVGLVPLLVPPKNLKIDKDKFTYEIWLEDKGISYKNADRKSFKHLFEVEDFETNFEKNYENNWYIGLNQKNFERVVFDYNNRRINIYLKGRGITILRIICLLLTTAVFIYAVIDVLILSKKKDKKRKNEQDLL